jgi:DinB superfamily
MTANDAIAFALTTGQALLKRYVADLTPQEYLHRPAPKANCVAWLIGHLTLSDRSLLKRLNASLPELPEGFEHQFSRDEGCPQAGAFGDVSTLMPLFDEHRNRLVAAVKAAPPGLLDKPLDKPHPLFSTVGEVATFLALHGAMHAGQITIIRRSLGRPPLI